MYISGFKLKLQGYTCNMMRAIKIGEHHFEYLVFCNTFSLNDGAGLVRGRDQKIPASPGYKPHWCCHCKVVVLGNGVQKSIKDLPIHIKVSD